MSYEKINFKNREVEKPLTFKKHVNDDGTITLEPKPGTIVEEGTPLLADHFNHMDDGIYQAHEEIDNLKLSGIERNKELVANLNSKKVSATTNDSLKTNIAKVKDIKLGSGNAVTSDVLEGKTFSSSHGTDLTGTMPNNGVLSKTITTQGGTQKISPGYYSGGEIKAHFSNLTSGNIKKGVSIGGVVGTLFDINDMMFVTQANVKGEVEWQPVFEPITLFMYTTPTTIFDFKMVDNIEGTLSFYLTYGPGSGRSEKIIYVNNKEVVSHTGGVFREKITVKPGDHVKLTAKRIEGDGRLYHAGFDRGNLIPKGYSSWKTFVDSFTPKGTVVNI